MWKSSRSSAPNWPRPSPAEPLYAKRLPFLRNVITVGSEQPGCLTWARRDGPRAGETPVEEVYRRAASISKHDVCNMQYTSGTTGFPKGVMLTHYNVVNNGKAIGDCMDLSTADSMMIQVPMFHCFGMVLAMTASMTHGTTMSPIPAFSAACGSTASTRSRSPPSTACPPCSSRCWSIPISQRPTSPTCAPASWPAPPAR